MSSDADRMNGLDVTLLNQALPFISMSEDCLYLSIYPLAMLQIAYECRSWSVVEMGRHFSYIEIRKDISMPCCSVDLHEMILTIR